MHDSKSFVKGALLLTLAGLISKVLSAGYRIPLQNVTGDIGFYIYQQVYPILGMASVLALYGFPAAVSKLAAEREMAGKQMSFTAFLLPVMIILLAIGLAIFGLLYTQADTLAEWIGDKRLIGGLRLAAFVFLLLPFSALLRGMFQANQQMQPTAYSQMAEQLVRVAIIIVVAVWLARTGADPYMIASAAGVAAISGTVAAILLLLVYVYRSKLHSPLRPLPTKEAIEWRYYLRTIVIFGMIQAVTHMMLLVIQLADTFTLLPNLLENGLSKLAAMQQKGIFDRGQPLIQFGSVLGSSFALALIPNIAKAHKKTKPSEMTDAIKIALAFGFYLAAGATLGLILLFPEVNMLLYENMRGTYSLQVLMASIVLSALCITAASILQSLGYLKRTAVYMLLAFACKWAANQFFVPMWGITELRLLPFWLYSC
ncbi:polysaccharide biosynthesis protein [Virgibacillus sp. 179-BFC.A HS]|uniref:Polysaccharide biosynthesis protein n=1 Tax=Tigheibacillus jepli TaxID=3035914 RepID=A0ABU5CE03_9BACI|nr:polysaccharide biosynthesis protein [Virgibacillus sp. 179-BFC.A HS]MDY0404039.1 polysaccharide biosynthesis protein [Virgibacillus sp. 179-BFC.A HS]